MLIQNLSKNGIKEKYEILAEFPFDSTRKRMTLIVRFGSKIILMCKGADSIILPRVTFRTAEEQE
jgi:magnesium-transporting ATPase (P-type)